MKEKDELADLQEANDVQIRAEGNHRGLALGSYLTPLPPHLSSIRVRRLRWHQLLRESYIMSTANSLYMGSLRVASCPILAILLPLRLTCAR